MNRSGIYTTEIDPACHRRSVPILFRRRPAGVKSTAGFHQLPREADNFVSRPSTSISKGLRSSGRKWKCTKTTTVVEADSLSGAEIFSTLCPVERPSMSCWQPCWQRAGLRCTMPQRIRSRRHRCYAQQKVQEPGYGAGTDTIGIVGWTALAAPPRSRPAHSEAYLIADRCHGRVITVDDVAEAPGTMYDKTLEIGLIFRQTENSITVDGTSR